jgi:hypothetical protein
MAVADAGMAIVPLPAVAKVLVTTVSEGGVASAGL